MMKKYFCVLLYMMGLFLFAGQNVQASEITDDGTLQLNPSLITSSEGALGASDDFPIRHALFTDELNRAAESDRQDVVSEQRELLHFAEGQEDGLYDLDTDELTNQLFESYQSSPARSMREQRTKQTNIVYWGALLLSVPLLIGGARLGQRQAKRKVRKQG